MRNDRLAQRPEKTNRGLLHRFAKAYGKAREWHCSRLRASVVGLRFAVWGDSGRFTSHGGWRVSRISRSDSEA
ncbi:MULTISPECIES: hypothetical protein [Stenotrophomonas]|jgi:hypothetical protein|uniref:hypothetical protein n=1 Tax=Stenotrophomonas TaxID=40323 RepID=UPI0009A1B37F|nr:MULTISPECIES: hypothetical protein [Stenotrophomonas]AWH36114.1 hypothetical protein C1929_04815 [Stenotrophomonas sp. ZAC14D1_NAIMI4_6]AWH40305.1 hypothetical protein C1927_05155 [Stenotrophomonas sp. ZAC14D1_NAIMI4_1]AWH46971.1 hypothetical protein C1926_19045 [Stenotrophomonas sp. ZAC14A_NAIMI4_1]MBK0055003.1 hypothetical protein [Stenotrophomonas sp. S39]MDI9272300.1 hypothetical protein [Stenotrophomonas sp. PFBMAA-4]